MVGHDVFDDGEAESGAGDLAAAGLVGAVEAFTETRQVFAFDAGALVFDAQPDGSLRRAGAGKRLQQGHPSTEVPLLRRGDARLGERGRRAEAERDGAAGL